MGFTKSSHRFVLFLVLLGIAITRFYSLDLDPPAYNQSGINVTDEPYYCISAVNEFLENDSRLVVELQNTGGYMLFQHNHAVNRLSLSVFGYTLTGLRFGVALMSLVAILFLFYSIKKSQKLNLTQQVVLLLLLGFDYYFFLISRYQNPMLYSVLWISGSLFALSFAKNRPALIGLAAALITIMVIWVYPYTAFVAIGFGGWVAYRSISSRSLKPIVSSSIGVIGGLLFLAIAFSFLGKGLTDYIELLTQVNDVRDESQTTLSVSSLVVNAMQIPMTNLFRYSPWLLIVLVMGAVPLIKNFRSLTNIEQVAIFCLVAALLQSLLMSSYPFKKWVVIYPFVIILFVRVLISIREWMPGRVVVSIFGILATGVTLYSIRVNNAPVYWEFFATDYNIVPLTMGYQSMLVIGSVLTLIGLMLMVWMPSKISQVWIQIPAIALSTLFALAYLGSDSYVFRDNLERIKTQLDNTLITGEFSHAFGLQNNGVVAHSPYDYSFGRISKTQVQESFDKYDRLAFIKKNLNQTQATPQLIHFDQEYRLESDGELSLYIRE